MMLRTGVFGITTALAMVGAQLQARDLVGTGFIEGKIVQLFSDGTWAYLVESSDPDCKFVHELVEFCKTDMRWRPQSGVTFDFDKLYSHDERHYGGLIIEEIGTADGNSIEGMITTVLTFAADAAGVTIEQIPVHSVAETQLDGFDAKTVVYGARIDGINYVYANSIIVEELLTIQALTWSVGKEFSAKHQELTSDFLSGIRINYEAPTQ